MNLTGDAVDDDGIGGIDDAGRIGDLTDSGNPDRARHDGDV